MTPSGAERIRVLVTVKAYPVAVDGAGEKVCVAGVRLDTGVPHFVRLWPVPFRDLPQRQRFAKYQEIDVDVVPSPAGRPESLLPIAASVRPGERWGTGDRWARRWRLLEPLAAPSMCAVQRAQGQDGTFFRPGTVTGFKATPVDVRDRGLQLSFDEPSRVALEEVPFKFRYEYSCAGEPACTGHRMRLLDWELGEAYRTWRDRYGHDGLVERLRRRWLDELVLAPAVDAWFFVGSIGAHPRSFCVQGVFWPPAATTGRDALF